ncbi:unnamed protein product [Phytophthora lilii]|uniref:RxLR effector protein n=1 Tax=Phytophthora lilii TaxID=2077276 RepID=A0A9W7CNC3_9STRA|nr:unnamed protein product [Phytophthora lilii]
MNMETPAILIVSPNSALAADETKLAKMGAPTSALSVNGVEGGARLLRSDVDISGAAKMFSKTKASYITKKLNKMLTNENYAEKKYAQWYKHPSLPRVSIEKVIRGHGKHFEGLITDYYSYIKKASELKLRRAHNLQRRA